MASIEIKSPIPVLAKQISAIEELLENIKLNLALEVSEEHENTDPWHLIGENKYETLHVLAQDIEAIAQRIRHRIEMKHREKLKSIIDVKS